MNIPPATDKLLGKFFKDVRKQDGGAYEPDSISSFQKSIQRHLKELQLPSAISSRMKNFDVPTLEARTTKQNQMRAVS